MRQFQQPILLLLLLSVLTAKARAQQTDPTAGHHITGTVKNITLDSLVTLVEASRCPYISITTTASSIASRSTSPSRTSHSSQFLDQLFKATPFHYAIDARGNGPSFQKAGMPSRPPCPRPSCNRASPIACAPASPTAKKRSTAAPPTPKANYTRSVPAPILSQPERPPFPAFIRQYPHRRTPTQTGVVLTPEAPAISTVHRSLWQ